MQHALQLAREAQDRREVPVGAAVMFENEIIGEGWNSPISSSDPTAHAEIMAIRCAALKVDNYRLSGAELFVTLEPCIMCAGAISHVRLSRLVYGARDPNSGAIDSVFEILESERLNHRTEVKSGVLEGQCATILKEFFRKKR